MKKKQKAWELACPRPAHNKKVEKLAKSLHCYATTEDYALSRREFLQNVVDRIVLDLEASDQ